MTALEVTCFNDVMLPALSTAVPLRDEMVD